jgi:thiamine biosynthesis protein ThiS
MRKIFLNGVEKPLNDTATLMEVVLEAGIPLEKVAIAVNDEIVPKSSINSFRLDDGSRVEVITFVGGG